MSNNAWTSNNQASRAPPRDEVAFNANEIRELLKQGFQSVSSEEEKSGSYKNASQSNSIKSAGAWSKGGMMAGNKDFFLELRKQITDIQQGERAGG